jgi:hypothetical protein
VVRPTLSATAASGIETSNFSMVTLPCATPAGASECEESSTDQQEMSDDKADMGPKNQYGRYYQP